MADPILRPAPVYYNGLKVAEIMEGSYDIDSNDQREITSEGYIGHTDGAGTTTMQATLVVPVAGIEANVLVDMIAKKQITVGIFTDGHYHSISGRFVKMSYTWNWAKGENRVTGHFEGGEPKLT